MENHYCLWNCLFLVIILIKPIDLISQSVLLPILENIF